MLAIFGFLIAPLSFGVLDSIACAVVVRQCRARWYQYMVALEQESMQRHGVVFVVVPLSIDGKIYHGCTKTFLRLQGVPLRRVANHFCLLNTRLNPTLRMFVTGLSKDFRLRLRIHLEGECVFCSLDWLAVQSRCGAL